jgi:hypothetical protein
MDDDTTVEEMSEISYLSNIINTNKFYDAMDAHDAPYEYENIDQSFYRVSTSN